MKKTILISVLVFSVIPAFTQTDTSLLKKYELKIFEIVKLNNDLQKEKQNVSDLNETLEKTRISMQILIKDLTDSLSSEKQKVADLSKNKVKDERDNLLIKVDSLKTIILKQNQTITDQNQQLINEKNNTKKAVENAKNTGKAEGLASILDWYKGKSFDEIIESSTKESVARDIQLVGDDHVVKPILSDLQAYFNAKELLSDKFDSVRINNAKSNLSQIKRQSKKVEKIKEDVEYFTDFNNALKETIGNIVNLDEHKSSAGDTVIQKLKFNDIVTILTGYMYDYYDYVRYPFLFDTVLEIIKRKKQNADTNIKDLLLKL